MATGKFSSMAATAATFLVWQRLRHTNTQLVYFRSVNFCFVFFSRYNAFLGYTIPLHILVLYMLDCIPYYGMKMVRSIEDMKRT